MPHQWNRLEDAPFARVNHQCISLNNVLYVFGGHNKAFNKIDLESIELDINSYDLTRKVWKKVITGKSVYQWDGKNKKLIKRNSRIDVPTLRFGHTVVVWRSRAWLFGGRSQKSECTNDVYMFCPATSEACITNHTFPIWAKGINLTGEIPIGCDGHAAAVLNDCMFIFGGYSETYHGFTNSLHSLDFLAWHWTMIKFVTSPSSFYPPELVNSSMESIFASAEQIFRSDSEFAASNSSHEIPISTSIPIPREFSSMQAHDGRLFLFGGRSIHPFRSPSRDIYDSTLWELLPVTIHHANSSSSLESQLICNEGITLFELELQAWEDNTESWHSSSRRFRCLHHHLKCPDCESTACSLSHGMHDNQNPWKNGFGYWKKVNIGHGLKTDDSLISLMGLHLKEAKQHRSMVLVDILNMNLNANDILANHANKLDKDNLAKFPLGRRSLSSWSYAGQIYISFGLVICTSHATVSDYSLHFNDLWCFNLLNNQWTCLRNHRPSDGLQNVSYGAMESLFELPFGSRTTSITIPLPRRRASACLVSSPPGRRQQIPPSVFVFGGARPRNYSTVLKVKTVDKPDPYPSLPLFNGCCAEGQGFLSCQTSLVMSIKKLASRYCSPVVWIVFHKNSTNLVFILPSDRVTPLPKQCGIHITTVGAASHFLSQNISTNFRGTESKKIYEDPVLEQEYFRATCRVAWEAVLHFGKKNDLLPETTHSLFNLLILSDFDALEQSATDPLSLKMVYCVYRQFYQLSQKAVPALLPAKFVQSSAAFHDVVCALLPHVVLTLSHIALSHKQLSVGRTLFAQLPSFSYTRQGEDWKKLYLPLLEPFLPVLLDTALSLDWTVSYSTPNLLDNVENSDDDSEYLFLSENSSTSSSGSDSPSSASYSIQRYQRFPGVSILENFFRLPDSNPTSTCRPDQSSQGALVLPHFGTITVDTFSSLCDSSDFYVLLLDSTLTSLCLRQLKSQLANNEALRIAVDQLIPENLKHCLALLHSEQLDWRWTKRDSADG